MKKPYIDNTPLYLSLSESIIAEARGAGMKSGDRLPNIKALARKYNVSEMPVRQALTKLRKEGKIEVVQGSGSFLKIDDASGVATSAVDEDFLYATSHLPFVTRRQPALNVDLIDGYPSQRAMWEGIVAGFQRRHADVEIRLNFNSDALREPGMVPDELPDLFQVSSYSLHSPELRDRLCKVTDSAKGKGGLFLRLIEPAVFNGECYGIPFYATFPLMIVNKSVVGLVGGAPAKWDWNGFIRFLHTLAEKKKKGAIPAAVNLFASILPPFYFINAMSDQYFSDEKGYDWAHPDIGRLLKTMRMVGEASSGMPSFKSQISLRHLTNQFREGKLCGIAMTSVFLNLFEGGLPDFAQVLPFPYGKSGRTFAGANYLVVSKESPFRERAFRLLDHILSDEVRTLALSGGFFHVHGRSPGEFAGNRIFGFEEDGARRMISTASLGKECEDFISDVFNPLFAQVCEGGITPEAAIEIIAGRHSVKHMVTNGHPPE